MKQTEQKYAEALIQKYRNIDCCDNHIHSYEDGNICNHLAIQCAIIDVENTLEALDSLQSNRNIQWNKLNTYYKNVLKILKDKL